MWKCSENNKCHDINLERRPAWSGPTLAFTSPPFPLTGFSLKAQFTQKPLHRMKRTATHRELTRLTNTTWGSVLIISTSGLDAAQVRKPTNEDPTTERVLVWTVPLRRNRINQESLWEGPRRGRSLCVWEEPWRFGAPDNRRCSDSPDSDEVTLKRQLETGSSIWWSRGTKAGQSRYKEGGASLSFRNSRIWSWKEFTTPPSRPITGHAHPPSGPGGGALPRPWNDGAVTNVAVKRFRAGVTISTCTSIKYPHQLLPQSRLKAISPPVKRCFQPPQTQQRRRFCTEAPHASRGQAHKDVNSPLESSHTLTPSHESHQKTRLWVGGATGSARYLGNQRWILPSQ